MEDLGGRVLETDQQERLERGSETHWQPLGALELQPERRTAQGQQPRLGRGARALLEARDSSGGGRGSPSPLTPLALFSQGHPGKEGHPGTKGNQVSGAHWHVPPRTPSPARGPGRRVGGDGHTQPLNLGALPGGRIHGHKAGERSAGKLCQQRHRSWATTSIDHVLLAHSPPPRLRGRASAPHLSSGIPPRPPFR